LGLEKTKDSSEPGLRDLLSEESQKRMLRAEIEEVTGSDGLQFQVSYVNPNGSKELPRTILLANKVPGDTPEQRVKAFAERVEQLPDFTVEQMFPSSETGLHPAGTSRFFNVRTTEKEPELVQATLDRLLRREKNSK